MKKKGLGNQSLFQFQGIKVHQA